MKALFSSKIFQVAEIIALLSLFVSLVSVRNDLNESKKQAAEQEIYQHAEETMVSASLAQLNCQSTLVALRYEDIDNKEAALSLQATIASLENARKNAEAILTPTCTATSEKQAANGSARSRADPVTPTAAENKDVTPTALQEPESEVAQFIRDYYQAINERKYDVSWSMLSPKFKSERNAGGFEPYTTYWDTVQRVDVQDIDVKMLVLSSTKDPAARVTLSILYTKVDGTTAESKPVYLIHYYPEEKSWKFDY